MGHRFDLRPGLRGASELCLSEEQYNALVNNVETATVNTKLSVCPVGQVGVPNKVASEFIKRFHTDFRFCFKYFGKLSRCIPVYKRTHEPSSGSPLS